jgi:3-oxoacyl-[acyl-carrier protein] reductase
MDQRLQGRVCIVTGGGHGIGKAYCEAVTEHGAAVVVAEIDGDAAERTAASLRASGKRALEVQTDVADERSTQAMAERTLSAFGRIDVLVNNAAVFATIPISRVPLEQIRRCARAEAGPVADETWATAPLPGVNSLCLNERSRASTCANLRPGC